MEGLLLPCCAVFFSSLLCLVYFLKKRINLVENNMYGTMLVTILIDSIIVTTLRIIGMHELTPKSLLLISFLNKIDFIVLLIYISSLFAYIAIITIDKVRKKYNLLLTVLAIIDTICSLLICVGSVEAISSNGNYSVAGSATSLILVFVGLYIIASLIIVLTHLKKVDKRHLPIAGMIFIIVLLIFLFRLNPYLILISISLTFLNYFMYFTIENPDMKMAQQLEVAREQADKANRAKTDFLSSMSHEIRTPLNAIVGFSDCIADATTLGEAQENAKDIVNASQTLLEIVNGILDISKIEAGKIEIINSKYNAPETFEELAKLITPKMNEKGLDFSYTIAPDLPLTLFGDHANIKKIVTNLLSNACKYTDKGFVHYEVNCINTKGVSKLIISVEDSGRGIKKDSVDKMFTKFQRLDEDRNTTIEGTGLGLAITKQLIELMGGRIIVHTVYGQGSKFTVVLNQKITTADEVSNKKVKTTLDLNNVKILMVDDTPLNLKVGCKLLEKYGANNIVTCASGFECIDRINRGEVYDVILLDDMMPKMSGVETLGKLKENPNFKIPTIALTANAITGMREKYLADGFDDYLAKPIEQNQLIQVMNQVLGRSATEDISIAEVQKTNEENIRSEEIPNIDDQEKAEAERENNSSEDDKPANPDIIPIEDNIEEILGDELDMNYREKTMMNMEPIPVENNNSNEIEVLDEPTITEVKPIETIPVMNIGPIPEVPNMPNLYDRNYLEDNGVDVDHALELLGDMDMYNMTISDFVNDVENKWNKIVEYKNTNDMPNYAIEVHSLKSDCKYLGFMKLADIAYQHELKSKDNDSIFVNNNFIELETEYKKVLEIAKEYTEHNKIEG